MGGQAWVSIIGSSREEKPVRTNEHNGLIKKNGFHGEGPRDLFFFFDREVQGKENQEIELRNCRRKVTFPEKGRLRKIHLPP